MDEVDDRTFRVKFSADGLVKLKDRIDSKIKEFLGDYTDDTLVEYVLLLIGNGRHKKEAKSELNVFLGDDSDSFVSWLWDHLTSNLDQFVESQKPVSDETLRPKAALVELAGTNTSRHLHSDKQAEFGNARRSRKWRALTSNESQQPSLRSIVVGEIENERKASLSVHHKKKSVSPKPSLKRKRSQVIEHENKNEHERPEPNVVPCGRLFLTAVRDALATPRPSSSLKQPGAKRLRSLVFPPSGDSALNGRPHRIESIARVPNTIPAAVKAVTEAAEDAVKVRSTRTVFDQLNHGVSASERADEVALFRDYAPPDEYGDYYYQLDDHQVDDYHNLEKSLQMHLEQGDYSSKYIGENLMDSHQGDYYHNLEKNLPMQYEQGDYSSKYIGNTTMQWTDTGLASDFASDYQGYDAIDSVNDRRMNFTQTGSSSGRKRDESLMVQYNMAQKADHVSHQAQQKQQDPSFYAASDSRKVLNISVNVNSWKPPQYQSTTDDMELDTRRSLQHNEVGVAKSSARVMKANKNSLAPDRNENVATQRINETQKHKPSDPGLYSTGRSSEDADARIIFVNNVHFAATKGSLSGHFKKIGEVLKVIILTDAATGQPKGSAYVEFMLKEAAENALSLDGTSFMSRILKVVKKSSGHQEASTATCIACPRVSHGSPLAAARFSRAPFPRVFPGDYRARPPAKPGSRSMQWKRDTHPSTLQNVSTVGNKNNAPSVARRGLTYIRQTKPTSKPGAA